MASFTFERKTSFFIVPSIPVPVGDVLVVEKIRLKVKLKKMAEVMSLVSKGQGSHYLLLEDVIEGWDEEGELAPRDESGQIVPPTPENIHAFCQCVTAVRATSELYLAALRGERLGN